MVPQIGVVGQVVEVIMLTVVVVGQESY